MSRAALCRSALCRAANPYALARREAKHHLGGHMRRTMALLEIWREGSLEELREHELTRPRPIEPREPARRARREQPHGLIPMARLDSEQMLKERNAVRVVCA